MNKQEQKQIDILNIIETQLRKRFDKFKTYKAEPALKPSSIGHPCLRKIYYDYWRVDQDTPFDYKSEIIFNMGSKLHEMVQAWLKDSDVFVSYQDKKNKYEIEFPVEAPDLLIKKGKIDGILKIDNKLWILEIKTINDIGFDFLTEPKKDHTYQGMLYVFLFEENLQRGLYPAYDKVFKNEDKQPLNVEGIIYLYLNKNSAKLKSYTVLKDEALYKEILDKIQQLIAFIKAKELPPHKKTKLCSYCPFFNTCKNNNNIGDSNA